MPFGKNSQSVADIALGRTAIARSVLSKFGKFAAR
jgi:hypothetical protein